MAGSKLPGYVGKILRVNLSTKKMKEENLDETTLKKWLEASALRPSTFMMRFPRVSNGTILATVSFGRPVLLPEAGFRERPLST